MYKIKNNISPLPVRNLFLTNNCQYNLRKKRAWEQSNIRTVTYGTETIRYRGPKTWAIVPQHIKESITLQEFKIKIKSWKPDMCDCRLCKTFVPELGFIG